ncbi:MAG: hypothetical protein ACEY3E_03190 [Candidatus Tisiphia sp.]
MKTTLPERSLVIKERLETIIQEILAAGKSKIAMIVLFVHMLEGIGYKTCTQRIMLPMFIRVI